MRTIYKFYLNIEQIVNVSVVWSEACSYHTVHGKVIVLRLKLHCMRVTGSDLRVAVQKQTFVVCDPIKHLQENIKEKKKKKSLICYGRNLTVMWEIHEHRRQSLRPWKLTLMLFPS